MTAFRNSLRIMLAFCLCTMVLVSSTLAADVGCESTYPIRKAPENRGPYSVAGCAYNATGYNYGEYAFTSKIVHCIEGTIRGATMSVMNVFSIHFTPVLTAFCTLVIIFHGIRVAMGEQGLQKRTMLLFVKWAFVGIFLNSLPTLVGWVFGTLNDFLYLVTGGASPWAMIDNFMGNLFGFGPSLAIMNGLLGLVGAAAFSSSVGSLTFFTGLMGFLNVITFIITLVFDYLLAYITIGFLLVFAPVMIPMSLFSQTDRYFKKWADIMVAAIITPILLFAFVWMFVGIFDILIANIFGILGGNDFRAYWRNNQPLFSWLMPSDPNATSNITNVPVTDDLCGESRLSKPPTQLTSNPFAKNSVDAGFGKTATLDFGANDVNIMTQLSLAFTTLWIFSACMKSMIMLIPQIASGIASIKDGISDADGGSALVGKLQSAVSGAHQNISGNLAQNKEKIDKASSYAKQFNAMIRKRDRNKK